MPWEHDIPGLDEARDALTATLNEHVDALGPVSIDNEAEHGDKYVCSEWVTVVQWTSLENGGSYITCTAPDSVLLSHRKGLLHQALFGMDD